MKAEEIYSREYQDREDLRNRLREFIEQYYNRLRLHSALAYLSPEQFEQQQLGVTTTSAAWKAASVSFSGHGTIFQSNGEQPQASQNHSPTHCIDESSTGYSWAGCSPAEPACASPVVPIVERKGSF